MSSDGLILNEFQQFLHQQAVALRSIANRASYEISVDDVKQDAWLIAIEISEKRGHAVNFADANDQSMILAWLTNRLVKFASKVLKIAVRMDVGSDRDDAPALSLPGPKSDDPLYKLLWREESDHFSMRIPPVVLDSYSEASAYTVLLARFDGDKPVVAKLLGITVGTLRERLRRSMEWISIQPSLFDRILQISMDFHPASQRQLSATKSCTGVVFCNRSLDRALTEQLVF